MFIWLIFFLLTPLFFLRQLTEFASPQSDKPLSYGIFLAFGMMCSDTCRSVLAHQYWHSGSKLGSNLRSLMYSVVYRKAIELRDLSGYTVGELTNLCSNDGQRFYDACTDSFFIYSSFLMTIVVVITSSIMIGPYALVGCAVYLGRRFKGRYSRCLLGSRY